jgi:uncharacterized protein YdaU (DUF1376 family)
MSRADRWFPLYVADYRRDTARLSTLQHGCYLLLIMDYWAAGPPPDDDVILARIVGLDLASWQAERPAIVRFFKIRNGEWRHKRVDAERTRAARLVGVSQANGKLGGRPRKTQWVSGKNLAGTQSQSHRKVLSQEKNLSGGESDSAMGEAGRLAADKVVVALRPADPPAARDPAVMAGLRKLADGLTSGATSKKRDE